MSAYWRIPNSKFQISDSRFQISDFRTCPPAGGFTLRQAKGARTYRSQSFNLLLLQVWLTLFKVQFPFFGN